MVESQLGSGSTFHIYLPATEKAAAEKVETVLMKGSGKILVMDDEEALRRLVSQMLERLGYEVETATGGTEAIEIYQRAFKSGKPFDAVILDLTIPGGMGGKECVARLVEVDPEVKAIVSSGYSEDQVLANIQEYSFKGVIPKPYKLHQLSRVLHEVLKGGKV